MKKLVTLLLSISLVLALGACVKVAETTTTVETSLQTTADESTGQPTSEIIWEDINQHPLLDEPVTITFWHIYGQNKADLLNDLLAEFVTLYPNITVESVSQGSYDDLKSKTISAISTGVTPDLLVGYPDHFAEYLNGNAVIPLDSYINNGSWGVDLTDFIDSYVEENSQYKNGLMYSMPYSKSTEMMVYNKTVFDHHNITLPTDRPITYQELESYAATIMGTGDYQCEYLINYDSSSNLFINATRQWNGEYTNSNGDILVDNDNTKAMLTYFDDLFDRGIASLPIVWDQNYGSANFLKGDVCMTVGSTAGISYNVPKAGNEGKFDEFEIGVAPIPQKADGTNSAMQQGPNIGIMADTTEAERLASWLLIRHLTSVEATSQWSMDTGYLPVRYSAYNSDEYQDFLDVAITKDPLSDYIDYIYESMTANAAHLQVDYYEYDPAFAGKTTSSSARQEAGFAMEAIFAGTKTVQKAIDYMIGQLVW